MPLRVAFDFDGTLTTRDSIDGFYRALCGSRREYLARSMPLRLCRSGKRLRLRTEDDVKAWGFRAFIAGRAQDELEAVGRRYARRIATHRAVLDRLEAHLARGSEVFLITASWEVYAAGFRDGIHTIGTEIVYEDGVARRMGRHCAGAEKVRLLDERFGVGRLDEVYTDSWVDRPLLELADRPFFVRRGQIVALDPRDRRTWR